MAVSVEIAHTHKITRGKSDESEYRLLKSVVSVAELNRNPEIAVQVLNNACNIEAIGPADASQGKEVREHIHPSSWDRPGREMRSTLKTYVRCGARIHSWCKINTTRVTRRVL